MSPNVGVGHGLGDSLDHGGGGSDQGSGGSSNNWGRGSHRGGGVRGVGSIGVVVVGVVVARVGTKVVVEGVVGVGGSVGIVSIMSIVVSIGISFSISLGSGLSLGLSLDQRGGHMSEGTSGGPGEESRLDSTASRSHTVSGAESHGGQSGGGNSSDNRGGGEAVNQRGVMEEGGGVDLSVDNSGSLDHRLDNWGVGNSGNWGGEGSGEGSGVEDRGSSGESVEGSHSWCSNCERGRSGNSGGSSHNRGGGSKGEGGNNGGGDSLGNGVNKPVHVEVLREPVEGEGLQSTGGSDSISEGRGQRSGKLGVSLGLSLVKTVDRLVTGAWERAGISRGGVRPVEVGVAVGGVVVQRIGFRLSQAKRGYGENYDLNRRAMLNTACLSLCIQYFTMHFIFA
jgi:hypothetical protein